LSQALGDEYGLVGSNIILMVIQTLVEVSDLITPRHESSYVLCCDDCRVLLGCVCLQVPVIVFWIASNYQSAEWLGVPNMYADSTHADIIIDRRF
jgi:hypothetical protein